MIDRLFVLPALFITFGLIFLTGFIWYEEKRRSRLTPEERTREEKEREEYERIPGDW
jgi:hypothetical protein